jgi:hypothetical protein
MASQDDKFEFVNNIAKGNLNTKEICNWIEDHLLKHH